MYTDMHCDNLSIICKYSVDTLQIFCGYPNCPNCWSLSSLRLPSSFQHFENSTRSSCTFLHVHEMYMYYDSVSLQTYWTHHVTCGFFRLGVIDFGLLTEWIPGEWGFKTSKCSSVLCNGNSRLHKPNSEKQ